MEKFEAALRRVRERTPLVQCITNILLASGASPTMAHDIREAAEAVTGADALVCNMGAIEDTDAMILAGKQANRLGKPVILDPVAAGGTALRRDSAGRLLSEIHFAVIRGNASEIRGLAGETAAGSGVDAGVLDVVTEENLLSSLEMVYADHSDRRILRGNAGRSLYRRLRRHGRHECVRRAGGKTPSHQWYGQCHVPHRSHRRSI